MTWKPAFSGLYQFTVVLTTDNESVVLTAALADEVSVTDNAATVTNIHKIQFLIVDKYKPAERYWIYLTFQINMTSGKLSERQ